MGDPSAILAINSLDRYITDKYNSYTQFVATCAQGAFQVTFIPSVLNGTPTVGGILNYAAPTIPAGTIITAFDPITNIFTINNATTATIDPPGGIILQTVVVRVSNNQPVQNSLDSQFNDAPPYSNNFTIQSPNSLINGYINKIVVSQIQLQYNIPTVCLGKNDLLMIGFPTYLGIVPIVITEGFYYADELAAFLDIQINANATLAPLMIGVVFEPRDGFVFTSHANPPVNFYFPSIPLLSAFLSADRVQNALKCYRLLGITVKNSDSAPLVTVQTSYDYPNFLYTPYIDIYSDILTNYQKIKDTNTSIPKPKGLVARIYVSGTGQIQVTGSTSALGTAPFVMTSDLNSPKVIRWTPESAVPSLDFQVLDQYGDLIPGAERGFSTEFQMTLLCIEGRDEA